MLVLFYHAFSVNFQLGFGLNVQSRNLSARGLSILKEIDWWKAYGKQLYDLRDPSFYLRMAAVIWTLAPTKNLAIEFSINSFGTVGSAARWPTRI